MNYAVLRGGGSLVVPATKTTPCLRVVPARNNNHGVVMRRSIRWLHLNDKRVQQNETSFCLLSTGARRPVTNQHATTRRTMTTTSTSSTTHMEPTAAHLHNALRLNPNYGWAWTLAGGLCLVGVFAGNKGMQVVPTGQVGVVEVLGVVQADLLLAGMHWVNPLATVTKFSVQPQHLHVQAPNSRVRGGLFVDMDMIVVYKFHPEKIKDLYIQIGNHNQHNNNFLNSDNNDPWHLEAITRSVLQSVVARRTVDEVHKTHQLAIAQEIQQLLLEQFRPTPLDGVIQIDQVVLKKVTLPDYFIDSIQELHRLDLAISAEKRAAHQKFIQAKAVADTTNVLKRNLQNLHNPNNHQQHAVAAATPTNPPANTNHYNAKTNNSIAVASPHPQHAQQPNNTIVTPEAENSKTRVPIVAAKMQPKRTETKLASPVVAASRRPTDTFPINAAKTSTQSSTHNNEKHGKQIMHPAASITTSQNTASNTAATGFKKLHPKTTTTKVCSRDATDSSKVSTNNENDSAAATNAAVAAREKQP